MWRAVESVDENRAFALMALDCALHQFARIEQMLRAVVLAGPAAAFDELDADEVTDFTAQAVAHDADELAIAVVNANGRTFGNSGF